MDATHTTTLPSSMFPLLKPSDILQCMQELEIDLTKSELTEPARHKEKLRRVFEALLMLCSGVSEEDLKAQQAQCAASSPEEAPYAELHNADTFGDLVFFQALQKLFHICGYYEFSWRDLYAPEPKRLRSQLSAILNLAKFRAHSLSLYGTLNEPRQEILKTIEALSQENTELNQQLDITEKEAQSKFHEMEQVIQECEELEAEIAAQNRLQATAREQAEALKKKANDLKDELATSTWALQEAEAEEERLRLQVVSSPDRRKGQIMERRQRLDLVKQECANLEKEIQESKAKIANVMQVSKSVESINTTLDELQVQAVKYSKVSKQLEETLESIRTIDKQTSEYEQATEQAERELHRMEEKIVHSRKQQAMQMNAVQEALENAKSQLLAVEKDRRDGMARVEAAEQKVADLQADMDRITARTAEEINDMIGQYQKVEQAFLERNENRMALLA